MRTAARLAAVDEANLVLDHVGQVNVFLVAGLLSPGGFIDRDGHPDLVGLRTRLHERIARLPSLRRVPVADGRRHRWVEATLDLELHVRLIDPVDGLEGLERKCGELMTVPLSLDRPPWELLVVPGASEGRMGVVLRIHHAIADGMTAVSIVQQLFEPAEPDAGAIVGSTPAVTSMPLTPTAAVHPGPDPLRVLGKIGFGIRRILTTLIGRGIGPTLLLGDRGPRRGVAFVDADLDALEAHVRPLGATANDALLAAVAAGYIAALSGARAQRPAAPPGSVPVALRRGGTAANQVGVMLIRLPVAMPDPEARLRLIAARTRKEKGRAREQGTLELMRGPPGP